MVHDSPDTSSLLPLNHLTLNGGVPLKTLVKMRLVPGKTSTESGICSKDGGSGTPTEGREQEKKRNLGEMALLLLKEKGTKTANEDQIEKFHARQVPHHMEET